MWLYFIFNKPEPIQVFFFHDKSISLEILLCSLSDNKAVLHNFTYHVTTMGPSVAYSIKKFIQV